jgi:phage protein D
MVKYPTFKILANDTDVTLKLQKELISLTFKDEANEKADELSIEVGGEFARPKYKDELKLYLGYAGEALTFCGLFIVGDVEREDDSILHIEATSVNFSANLKEKRDITYEKVSIKDICNQIASRGGLKLKSDFEDIHIVSLAQSNESDLHFLNRLSKEYNSIFNIKNGTLIFTKKIKDDKKNEELPSYIISEKNTSTISIQHSNKTLYKSCKSTYHDTKNNKVVEVIAGSGKPCLISKGSFKNEAEAMTKAKAKLDKANQGLVSGSLTIEGEVIFAGGKLVLIDTLEDDGEYQIKSVSHTFDVNGWVTSLEFER